MKTKNFGIVFLYIFLLFLFAIIQINGISSTVNNTYILQIRLDHLFHLLFFSPWMTLPIMFSEKKSFTSINVSPIFWFFCGLILAVCTECVQYFLSYRSFTLPDLLFNISGLLLGWLCLTVLKASCNSSKNI